MDEDDKALKDDLRKEVQEYFTECADALLDELWITGCLVADLDDDEAERVVKLISSAKVVLKWGR